MNKPLTEHLRYGSLNPVPKNGSRGTIDTILSHQSCRTFSDQPINDEIKQLLFAATIRTQQIKPPTVWFIDVVGPLIDQTR